MGSKIIAMVDVLSRLSRSHRDLEKRTVSGIHTNNRWIGSEKQSDRQHTRRVTHLLPELAAEIVERYQTGSLIRELAEEYGVHRSTVMACLRRAGVPKYSGWSEKTTAEATRLYESGLTIAEVAARLDHSATTVGRRLREAGVKMRPKGFQADSHT